MADRIASVSRFRAEAVRLSWAEVARQMVAAAGRWNVPLDDTWLVQLANKAPEIALRWAVSGLLGVPPGPFTVWVRPAGGAKPERRVTVGSHPLGTLLSWQGEASTLEVSATVADGSRPVLVVGFRGSPSPFTAVASETAAGATNATVDVLLRSSGMTCALLLNAFDLSANVDHLADVVRSDDWKELEVVGLPLGDGPEGIFYDLPGYDSREQGMVADPTSPAEAALQRLERGGPPVGWWPVTETGQLALPWTAPDPKELLVLSRTVLPEVLDLFTVPPQDQAALRGRRDVPPPEQDGRTLAQPSSATVSPFGALLLPATADPFYALALGFGTGYGLQDGERLLGMDFLVTADYPDTPEGGPATYAAYIPRPVSHGASAPVTGLSAARDGLVRPVGVDEPWRESLRISWDDVGSSMALGRPTGFSLLRSDPGGGTDTELLLDRRTDRDWLPRVPMQAPGTSRDIAVDRDQVVPLGSGGHTVGYCVAVQDIFGIWSTWEDTATTTAEPGPPLPRILSARLDASYTGSPLCPAVLVVEVALDWSDRSIAQLELTAVPYAAFNSAALPPAGTAPGAVAATVTFAGDVPSGSGVVCLDPSGTTEVPPGPAQGVEGRRYRLTVPLTSLDYSSTRWYGVALWARTTLNALGTTPWTPSDPVLAAAASPVPPALPLPPPLPGVPVGSTPDARGRSHVRVVWGDPAGPVDHFAVYEVAETALRSAAGLGAPLPTDVPGARLLALRQAYDLTLTPTRQRAVFRRLSQPPAADRSADVALPQGSTDIHLLVVVGVAPSGVESPWPSTSDALQAFRAPVVLAPAPPVLRSSFGTSGGTTALHLDVEAASPLPVQAFRLYGATSVEAARSAETMGSPFAEVPATDSGDPVSDTGTSRYVATWQGAPVIGWRPVRYRAVAVPVLSVPVDGVVGVPSPGSALVPVSAPPTGPPDLEVPVASDVDATVVVVRTAVTAPLFLPDAGPFVLRASATVGGVELFPEARVLLSDLPSSSAPPPATAPAWTREDRTGGRTPLAFWFDRAAPADEVTVTLRLADPLGRVTTRVLVVPPETVPVPPSLDIVDAMVLVGRGILLHLTSDAAVDETPGGHAVLLIVARRRAVPHFPPGLPHVPLGPRFPPRLPPMPSLTRIPFPPHVRPLVLEVAVPDIPLGTTLPPAPGQPILVVRRAGTSPAEYTAFVRLSPPTSLTLTMTGPGGASTTRSVEPF